MKKSLKEILAVAIAIAAIFISRNLYDYLLNLILNSNILTSEITSILSYLTPLAVIYIAHKTITPISFDINKKCDIETSIYEALGLLLLGGVLSFVMVTLGKFINNDTITAGNNMINHSRLTILEGLLIIISVAIIGPIVEEILFRGILLGALKPIMDVRIAILLSSVVFGLLHRTSVMMVVVATISGIVLSCIYLYHINLINSIIVHAMFNFIATLSAIRPRFPVELSEIIIRADTPLMIMIGLGLTIYFIIIGRYIFKRLKEKYSEHKCLHNIKVVPLLQ